MALGAAAGAVEILLAGLGVSRLQIGGIDVPSIAFERIRLGLGVVNEGDDRREVRLRKRRGWHPLVNAATVEERDDLVALYVFGHERGAREIGPRFTAHRVAAMAEPAVGGEKPLATLDQFGRISLRRHRLGRLLRSRTLLCRAASALARRGLTVSASSS